MNFSLGVILVLLGSVGSALATLLGETPLNRWRWCSFTAILITIGGGLWIANEDANKAAEVAKKSSRILSLTEFLSKRSIQEAALNQSLAEKSDEIAEVNKALAAKSEEAARTSREVLHNLTGGDSFCYVTFMRPLGTTRAPLAALIVEGRYPMHEVFLRVVDLARMHERDKSAQLSYEDVQSWDAMRGSIGTVLPGYRDLGRLSWPDRDTHDYNIFIYARNGAFTQNIRYRRVDEKWVIASRLWKGNRMDQILWKKIDPEYPLDADGQVVW